MHMFYEIYMCLRWFNLLEILKTNGSVYLETLLHSLINITKYGKYFWNVVLHEKMQNVIYSNAYMQCKI